MKCLDTNVWLWIKASAICTAAAAHSGKICQRLMRPGTVPASPGNSGLSTNDWCCSICRAAARISIPRNCHAAWNGMDALAGRGTEIQQSRSRQWERTQTSYHHEGHNHLHDGCIGWQEGRKDPCRRAPIQPHENIWYDYRAQRSNFYGFLCSAWLSRG
jgi:hypothetical protein